MTRVYLRWLNAGAIYAMVVGAGLLAVGVVPAIGFDRLAATIFPANPADAGGATGLARLATSVSGALTVFVGVMAWALRPALRLPDAGPVVARAFVLSLGVWFVLDSTASVLVGAPMNALGNVTLMIALLPPLIAAFRPRH